MLNKCNMRVGVLSYPLNNNYGCYLQAYALTTVLRRMGHDVTYIHRRHDKPRFRYRVKYFVKTIYHNLFHSQKVNPIYRYEWLYMIEKGREMLPFFEKHIPHTTPYYSSAALRRNCQHFDAIIVGSDQVWRAQLLHNIEDYYLRFLKNDSTLRISYAASFGKQDAGYSDRQINRCGELIRRFKAVSLRESQGVDVIRNFGWMCPNITVVLDPTMLLKEEDYEVVLPTKTKQRQSQLFCYILDETDVIDKVVQQVSERLGKEPNNILHGRMQKSYRYKSVEYWLNCFRSASFVITDSFHGTVFSIIFNVPFIVVPNLSRGSDRINSLLKMFQLEDRLYDGDISLEKVLSCTIDWSGVNMRMEREREKSLRFLISALCDK